MNGTEVEQQRRVYPECPALEGRAMVSNLSIVGAFVVARSQTVKRFARRVARSPVGIGMR